jgi:error-prone DNA polymerase
VDAARREELIQYLYTRYGQNHVALACTFITFQARSALNEVAQALGVAPALLREVELGTERAEDEGLRADDPAVRLIGELCREVHGLPRHLGQHSGGMIVTGPPLS